MAITKDNLMAVCLRTRRRVKDYQRTKNEYYLQDIVQDIDRCLGEEVGETLNESEYKNEHRRT